MKCLEQNRRNTWSLITSCCFDRVCALFICVFSCGPGRIMVSLYGSSPRVKRLVGLAAAVLAPFCCSFIIHHHTLLARPNGSWQGEMVTAVLQVVGVLLWWPFVYTLGLPSTFLCWLFFINCSIVISKTSQTPMWLLTTTSSFNTFSFHCRNSCLASSCIFYCIYVLSYGYLVDLCMFTRCITIP